MGRSGNPRQCVADDAPFGLQLSAVLQVLELTASAPVAGEVRTRRFDSHIGGAEQRQECTSRHAATAGGYDAHVCAIARRRPRCEHHDAIRAANPVAARSDRCDVDVHLARGLSLGLESRTRR